MLRAAWTPWPTTGTRSARSSSRLSGTGKIGACTRARRWSSGPRRDGGATRVRQRRSGARQRSSAASPDTDVTATPPSCRGARWPQRQSLRRRGTVRSRGACAHWASSSSVTPTMRFAVTPVAEHPGPCIVQLDAVRDPGRGGGTVVRLLIERDGRRLLRALDHRCPERPVDTGNKTDRDQPANQLHRFAHFRGAASARAPHAAPGPRCAVRPQFTVSSKLVSGERLQRRCNHVYRIGQLELHAVS